MICNECGQELKNSATFCGFCGATVDTAQNPQAQIEIDMSIFTVNTVN